MDSKEHITILLAEDDDGHARLIRRRFEEADVQNPVIRFNGGAEVWDFISSKNIACLEPDKHYVLLLDIRMPGMDGIEVLRRVKGDPRLKNMHVIMLTTTDDPKDIALCYELGCRNYLVKPVDSDRFNTMMKQLGVFPADSHSPRS